MGANVLKYFRLRANSSKRVTWPNNPQLKLGNIGGYFPIFKTACFAKNISRIINIIASICRENMLGHWSLDIICSSKLTVCFSEQIMSTEKYPSILLRQMDAIVYIFPNFQNCARCEKDWIINTIAYIWGEKMLGYLSLDLVYSSKFIVFLDLRSRKTVRFSVQIMSTDKYPSTFSRQMEANFRNCACCEKYALSCQYVLIHYWSFTQN